MTNSINTNVGAMVALATLRSTQTALDVASKQVQTGYRVADASDDASTFSVAQGIRGNLQAFQAVQASLANGLGLAQVTLAALTSISDLVGNLQAKSTQYLDGSISSAQQNIYSNDAIALYNQISNFISQAKYNGVNLLSNGSTAKTFLADTSASTLTLSSQSGIAAALAAYQPAMPTLFTVSLGTLATFRQAVDLALGQVATEARALRTQSNFVSAVADATTVGLGAIVDADVGKASASLQALQVRQQLGVQSLSIANQQPSVLLGLFR